jgi:hypothetical protein
MLMLGLNVTSLPTDDEFANILRLALLVSIDLIIRDNKQKVVVALAHKQARKGHLFRSLASAPASNQSPLALAFRS